MPQVAAFLHTLTRREREKKSMGARKNSGIPSSPARRDPRRGVAHQSVLDCKHVRIAATTAAAAVTDVAVTDDAASDIHAERRLIISIGDRSGG